MVNYLINTERKTRGIDYGIEEIEIYEQRRDRSRDIGMSPKVAFEYIRTSGVNIQKLGRKYQIAGYGLVTELSDLKNAIVMNGPCFQGCLSNLCLVMTFGMAVEIMVVTPSAL